MLVIIGNQYIKSNIFWTSQYICLPILQFRKKMVQENNTPSILPLRTLNLEVCCSYDFLMLIVVSISGSDFVTRKTETEKYQFECILRSDTLTTQKYIKLDFPFWTPLKKSNLKI